MYLHFWIFCLYLFTVKMYSVFKVNQVYRISKPSTKVKGIRGFEGWFIYDELFLESPTVRQCWLDLKNLCNLYLNLSFGFPCSVFSLLRKSSSRWSFWRCSTLLLTLSLVIRELRENRELSFLREQVKESTLQIYK